jgi:hypothetical protein
MRWVAFQSTPPHNFDSEHRLQRANKNGAPEVLPIIAGEIEPKHSPNFAYVGMPARQAHTFTSPAVDSFMTVSRRIVLIVGLSVHNYPSGPLSIRAGNKQATNEVSRDNINLLQEKRLRKPFIEDAV